MVKIRYNAKRVDATILPQAGTSASSRPGKDPGRGWLD
jgi:hypothetical protein